MPDVLDAYWEGRHVGVFLRNGATVSFQYDADAPDIPISLSLPRDGAATKHAAERFLGNMLPEDPATRAQWARLHGVPDTVFDLLGAVGEDLAGALVIVKEGHDPKGAASRPEVLVTDDELAYRIAKAHASTPVSSSEVAPERFSLAGAQAKFVLARIADRWYTSSASVPSTHIVKPGRADLGGIDELEAGGLALATAVGVPAARGSVVQVLGERAVFIERFDRDLTTTPARRIHAEDLAQAMGIDVSGKYGVTAVQAAVFLRDHVGEAAAYAFVDQLVFNVVIGNADAHAKNYSLLLRPTGIELAPLYDAVPTVVWGRRFDQNLAMPISGGNRPGAITVFHWAKFARRAGLDEARVVARARTIASAVRDHAQEAYSTAGVTGSHLEDATAAAATHAKTLDLAPGTQRRPPQSGAGVSPEQVLRRQPPSQPPTLSI